MPCEIAEAYHSTIDEVEVADDFCSFPPTLSLTQAVTRLKSLAARAIFREVSQIKRQLWSGEFWEEGYFARTLGDKVTADIVRPYIQAHRDALDNPDSDPKLDLF